MERRKILIATKTYPSISQKYKETVCTAGILLDENEKPLGWIRIYPIRFRSLEFTKRYKRWSIISAEIEKNDKDFRKESYRISDSSIQIIREIGTAKNWEERKSFILPFEFHSIKEMKENKNSVGIIKPKSIEKYFSKKTERDWTPKQKAVQDQGDFFEESFNLEKIPYQFRYKFTELDGTPHDYSISDWEISELYRKCRDKCLSPNLEEREQEGLLQVQKKLQDDFLTKKDLYFIIGNLKNHSDTFMIIGIFYPPKPKITVQNPDIIAPPLFDF
jgi:hypothetical protein